MSEDQKAENNTASSENKSHFSIKAFLIELALAPVAFVLIILFVSATETDLNEELYLFTIIGVILARLIGYSPLILIVPLLIGMKDSIMNGLKSGRYSDLTLEGAATVFAISYLSSFIMRIPYLFFAPRPKIKIPTWRIF